jgi:hypothetical protein
MAVLQSLNKVFQDCLSVGFPVIPSFNFHLFLTHFNYDGYHPTGNQPEIHLSLRNPVDKIQRPSSLYECRKNSQGM